MDVGSFYISEASPFGEPSPSTFEQGDLLNRCWALEFAGKQLAIVEQLQARKEKRRITELKYISRMIQQLKSDNKFLRDTESKLNVFEC